MNCSSSELRKIAKETYEKYLDKAHTARRADRNKKKQKSQVKFYILKNILSFRKLYF